MVILSVLLVDQITKVLIKTSMTLGQSIPVFGDWFIIHFTENYGMAFGLEFSGEYGKLMLSIFRILAVVFIGWYIFQLVQKKASAGLIASISLIMAGALGNIIDSAFYGLIFSESLFSQPATMFPEGGGYATFLHGKVVDLLYFPILQGVFPQWLPFVGGDPFIFFRPVFNIADSAITLGVFSLIVFQKRFFSHLSEAKSTGEKESGQNTEAMNGFLFEQIIFGPIKSRRLGISLGINLLPLNRKHCSYNCLYCECGWTESETDEGQELPTREQVRQALEEKLVQMKAKGSMLDVMTFAGNGEPTLHPGFAEIIEDTIALRNEHYPQARVAVLSNASTAYESEIAEALKKVDQNILKLDAGTEESFQRINNPRTNIRLADLVENLRQFNGHLTIQTLFLRGTYKGIPFDNTTPEEVEAWLKHLEIIKPELVMIYPIARATPAEDVEKVDGETLQSIATRVEAMGIPTEVYP